MSVFPQFFTQVCHSTYTGFNFGRDEPGNRVFGPCAGIRCRGIFQEPVPPSCECMCPGHDQTCSPKKRFNDNICECLCRDINLHCPGKSDFNFDECNCVCPLHENDCGPKKKFNPKSCACIKVPSPPAPPSPTCPRKAELKCRGDTQYLDPRTCKCRCRRFLVKKTYHHYSRHYYRHGRSPYASHYNEESRFRRSRRTHGSTGHSKSGSKRSRNTHNRNRARYSPVYARSCPAWKRANHKTCVCYW